MAPEGGKDASGGGKITCAGESVLVSGLVFFCVLVFSALVRLRAFTFSVKRSLIVHTAHKVCGAGEWIVAAGTATSDTKCQPYGKGTFRAKAPTNTEAEKEADGALGQDGVGRTI